MPRVVFHDGRRVSPSGSAWWLKRPFDVAVSLIGLVLLSPCLIVIAMLIIVESGWPSLFTQLRVGQNSRRFKLYKFRTMVVGAERIGPGLFFEKNDTRFTRVGRNNAVDILLLAQILLYNILVIRWYDGSTTCWDLSL